MCLHAGGPPWRNDQSSSATPPSWNEGQRFAPGASGEPRPRWCEEPRVRTLELDLMRAVDTARTRLRNGAGELQSIYARQTFRANGSSHRMSQRSFIGISWHRAAVGTAIVLAVAAATIWFVFEPPAESTVELVSPKGVLVVATARTPEARASGLSNRERIPHQGLLLVWETAGRRPIWMAEMLFPLDIVWLDARGRVLAALADVPPCDRQPCPLYEPSGTDRATAVLELPAGYAGRYGIAVDSIIHARGGDALVR